MAYRQPATKPEIDEIRGVDCGGTIRLLLPLARNPSGGWLVG